MLNNSIIRLLLLSTVLCLSACKDNNTTPDPKPATSGFFIVNEGTFGSSNASISYFDTDQNMITNDVFKNNNNDAPIGDQAQSMTIAGNNGYILVQNSNKIEVININTFRSVKTIQTDNLNPRYFMAVSEQKAYISDWSVEGVRVLDLQTNQLVGNVTTGLDPEQMAFSNGKLYVANSGFSVFPGLPDSTLSIIDVSNDQVTATVTLTYLPSYIQIDSDGKVWVLCKGLNVFNADFSLDEAASTPGALFKLDANGNELLRLDFPSQTIQPNRLAINSNKDVLYYLYGGGLYRMFITDKVLPTEAFIEKNFYGLAVNPATGNIIGTQAPNFTSAGSIYRYNAQGEEIDRHTVGIAPNGCAFPL